MNTKTQEKSKEHPLTILLDGLDGRVKLPQGNTQNALDFLWAAPETAAERDWLKEINAELLDACKFALDVATIQAKNPKTTSGTIQTLKDHLEVAIEKVEGRE